MAMAKQLESEEDEREEIPRASDEEAPRTRKPRSDIGTKRKRKQKPASEGPTIEQVGALLESALGTLSLGYVAFRGPPGLQYDPMAKAAMVQSGHAWAQEEGFDIPNKWMFAIAAGFCVIPAVAVAEMGRRDAKRAQRDNLRPIDGGGNGYKWTNGSAGSSASSAASALQPSSVGSSNGQEGFRQDLAGSALDTEAGTSNPDSRPI